MSDHRWMQDAQQAERLRHARDVILEAGAAQLPRRPWAPVRQPLSDVELVGWVLWRSAGAPGQPVAVEPLVAALELLPAARAELDQLEAGLLFTARSAGLTWPQVAAALGLGSPQAAQQRAGRVHHRTDRPGDGS